MSGCSRCRWVHGQQSLAVLHRVCGSIVAMLGAGIVLALTRIIPVVELLVVVGIPAMVVGHVGACRMVVGQRAGRRDPNLLATCHAHARQLAPSHA